MIPQKSSGSSFSSGYGTGGSTSQSSTTSPFGAQEGYSGITLGQQVNPSISDLLTSYQNLLTKGTISGQGIPMAQAAIAQARGAASANLGSAENFLARSGGANSPFAQQLLSSTAAQGNEAIAQAPVGIEQMMFSSLPGFLSGLEGQSLSAMGQAGALNTSSSSANQYTNHDTNRSYNKSSSGGFGF